MCTVTISRISTADFTLWRFCAAMAGTMLLALQGNILADGHDQRLRHKTELWSTNMVVVGLKRTATNVSCGSWKGQYEMTTR